MNTSFDRRREFGSFRFLHTPEGARDERDSIPYEDFLRTVSEVHHAFLLTLLKRMRTEESCEDFTVSGTRIKIHIDREVNGERLTVFREGTFL